MATTEAVRRPAAAAEGLDELLGRVAHGDREAFGQVYEHVAGTVLRAVRLVVGDAARAEHAVESAFLDIWRQAPLFDPARISATAWIVSLTQRHALQLSGSTARGTSSTA